MKHNLGNMIHGLVLLKFTILIEKKTEHLWQIKICSLANIILSMTSPLQKVAQTGTCHSQRGQLP